MPGVSSDSKPIDPRKEELRRKLLLTCAMFDLGVAMERQALRRAHPHLSEGELGALLRQWLQTRPGAEFGDCPGRAMSLESRD